MTLDPAVLERRSNRRESLKFGLGTALTYLGAAGTVHAVRPPISAQPVLLSSHGSGRASAYSEAVKSLTFAGQTHVTWLDSLDNKFLVRARSLDRATRRWSPTSTIGPAFDNHGGPAMTVDSKGYLHIVCYPHHHPFHYRQSVRPSDVSDWSDPIHVGDHLTYPTLVCGPDNTLFLSGRRSHQGKPWEVELWTRGPGQPWRGPRTLIRADVAGYSHFQEALAWGPDQKTLHLSCRIHQAGGQRETIGYMASEDGGKSWRKLNGKPVRLPATADTIDVLADGGRSPGKKSHKSGSMAVHSSGAPHILYSSSGPPFADLVIAQPDGQGQWQRQSLAPTVHRGWPDTTIGPPANMVFNQEGKLFVTGSIGPLEKSGILQMTSENRGRSFVVTDLSRDLPAGRRWWPNLERPTGHNKIEGEAGVLFTIGVKGEGNNDILSNKVYWSG